MSRSGTTPEADRPAIEGLTRRIPGLVMREDERAESASVTPGRRKAGRKKTKQSKPLIGWREWVRFPDLGVEAIKAKVDTGARTSSLHAFNLKEFRRDGLAYVRFVIHPEQDSAHPAIPAELPLLARRKVKDSGGKTELRPVVETTVELMGLHWKIEMTLTRRDDMGFRMLLGMQAIRRRFVVDPGASFRAGKRVRKKKSPP